MEHEYSHQQNKTYRQALNNNIRWENRNRKRDLDVENAMGIEQDMQ
jgi:hypothetical protein